MQIAVEEKLARQKLAQMQLLQTGGKAAGLPTYQPNCNAQHKQQLQQWAATALAWLRKANVCTPTAGG